MEDIIFELLATKPSYFNCSRQVVKRLVEGFLGKQCLLIGNNNGEPQAKVNCLAVYIIILGRKKLSE